MRVAYGSAGPQGGIAVSESVGNRRPSIGTCRTLPHSGNARQRSENIPKTL